MKPNPVVHFEMPYENQQRLTKFYSKAFGWTMTNLGSDMNDYITAGTTETDNNNMVKTAGAINGGFYPKSSGAPTEPSFVIAVDNINTAMDRIKKSGGNIIGEPVDIPGIGRYVSFHDTEGNRVSILQPKNM